MFSSVDLPHPLGPSRHTNSASSTARSKRSSATIGARPFSGRKTFRTATTSSLRMHVLQLGLDDRAPPAKEQILQAAEEQIEPEAENPDHRGADEHPVDEKEIARLLD